MVGWQGGGTCQPCGSTHRQHTQGSRSSNAQTKPRGNQPQKLFSKKVFAELFTKSDRLPRLSTPPPFPVSPFFAYTAWSLRYSRGEMPVSFLKKVAQKLFLRGYFFEVGCLWILFVRLLIGYFGCAVDAYCRKAVRDHLPCQLTIVSLCQILA